MFSSIQIYQKCFFAVLAVLFICHYVVFAADEQTPQQVLDLQQAAKQCIENNDYAGARAKYQEIVQGYPGTKHAMQAQSEIGVLYAQEGQTEKAEDVLDALSLNYQDQPNVVFAADNIISVYLKKQDYDAALRLCQKTLGQYADQPKVACLKGRLARIYILSDQNAKADAVIQSLIEEGPRSSQYENVFADAIFYAGDTYWSHNKQAEKQISVYRDFLNRYPDIYHSDRIHNNLICAYLRTDQTDKALLELDGFLSRYTDDDRLADVAGSYVGHLHRHGAYDKGIELAQLALSKHAGSEKGLQLQTTLIRCLLENRDAAAAKAELTTFFDRYTSTQGFVRGGLCLGHEFRDTHNEETAAMICERVLNLYPGHENVPDFLYLLKVCNRKLGLNLMNDLDGLVDKLLQQSNSVDRYLTIALACSDMYFEEKNYNRVLEISGAALEKYPSHAISAEILSKQVWVYLYQGMPSEAEVVVEKLKAEYHASDEFGRVMNDVAFCYHKQGYYQNALALYQLVLNSQPDSLVQHVAKSRIALVHVRQGDDQSVQEIVDSLMVDCKDEKCLGGLVFRIGEEYYLAAEDVQRLGNQETAKMNYDKAIAIWQRNIDQIEAPRHQPMAVYFSAVAHQKMGRDEDAITYYRQTVNSWPEFYRCWHALSMIAECYGILDNQQKVSSDVAKEKIKNAYDQLVRNYPDSPASNVAGGWLKANGWVEWANVDQ